MSQQHEDRTFEGVRSLDGDSYEQCRFVDCDLSNTSLADISFIDCVFQECNLLLATMTNTSLQNVEFVNCKLSGVDFGRCRDFAFSVAFDRCVLDNATFYMRKMKGTQFLSCSLAGADFTETDLSAAVFGSCNLLNATFDRTILRQADLRTAYDFIIDPQNNDIRRAKFTVYGLPGLLAAYGISVE